MDNAKIQLFFLISQHLSNNIFKKPKFCFLPIVFLIFIVFVMAPKCISHKVIFSISAVHQHPIGSSLITSGIVLDPLLDKVTTTLPLLLIEIFFAWGTSGYDQGAVYYQPYSINGSNSCYYAYGNKRANLYDQTGKADWGYNAISNGGNIEHLWRHPDSRTRLHVLLQQPRTENLDHQRGKSPTVTIFALSQLGQFS